MVGSLCTGAPIEESAYTAIALWRTLPAVAIIAWLKCLHVRGDCLVLGLVQILNGSVENNIITFSR